MPAGWPPSWSGPMAPGSRSARRNGRKDISTRSAASTRNTSATATQIDITNIRPVVETDRAEGFDPIDFVAHSRFDREQMYAELHALAETNIADEPLRRLVLKLLEENARAVQAAARLGGEVPAIRRRLAGAHPVGREQLSPFGGDVPGPLCGLEGRLSTETW